MNDTEQQSPPGSENKDDVRRSLLGTLTKMHKDVKSDKHEDFDIPGYDGKLFARFRPYEISTTEKRIRGQQQAVARHQPVVLRGACDTLIDACEQLFVRDDDGKELAIDELVPVKFDKRLAQLLGFDDENITSARHVVIELFPTQQAIVRMSAEVTEWLTTATSRTDEEFLENSEGTIA